MQFNSNELQEVLPHRYPMQLVDRITDGEPGKWAKGIKCVTVNEPFFCGHFPQEHVMPGVLILEAMAQVGAVAILSLPENQGSDRTDRAGEQRKDRVLWRDQRGKVPPKSTPWRCAGDGGALDKVPGQCGLWRGNGHGGWQSGLQVHDDIRH